MSDCGNLEKELPQHQDRRRVEQVRHDERGVSVDPAELHDQRVERNQRQLAGHQQHRHRGGVEPRDVRGNAGAPSRRPSSSRTPAPRAVIVPATSSAVEKRAAERRARPHGAVVVERDVVRDQRQRADLEWRLEGARGHPEKRIDEGQRGERRAPAYRAIRARAIFTAPPPCRSRGAGRTPRRR